MCWLKTEISHRELVEPDGIVLMTSCGVLSNKESILGANHGHVVRAGNAVDVATATEKMQKYELMLLSVARLSGRNVKLHVIVV